MSVSETGGGPRPAVVQFAGHMETKLKANDHKGGWDSNCSTEFLLAKLEEEVAELQEAVSLRLSQGTPESVEWVIYEAADVANICMMLAERAKGLPNGPRGMGR